MYEELTSHDLPTFDALKLTATNQTQLSRAESTILLWKENRLPFGAELRTVLESEADDMTALEMDVRINLNL